MKKLFKNRIFDLDGLVIVLINVSVPILVIGLFASFICFPMFWTIVITIALIVGVILVITHWIWKAFNLIFPKKTDKNH